MSVDHTSSSSSSRRLGRLLLPPLLLLTQPEVTSPFCHVSLTVQRLLKGLSGHPDFPDVTNFATWRNELICEVVNASGRTDPAFKWISEISTRSFEDLNDSGEFVSLDLKLAQTIVKKLPRDLNCRVCSLRDRMIQSNVWLK